MYGWNTFVFAFAFAFSQGLDGITLLIVKFNRFCTETGKDAQA